jgi:HK97 family phage portal protein
MQISRVFSRLGAAFRNSLNNPAIPLSMSAFAALFSDGEGTAAGELINEHSALKISWVYECVRVLAESVGSLPFKLYETTAKGRVEAVDHDIYYLLTVEPNPEMSAVTLWETLTGCLALTGNCYCQISRDDNGQPAALYPLHPLKTEPYRNADGKLAYRTTDGMQAGQWRLIDDHDMIHCRLFGWDGLKGLSPIMQARENLGLAKAAIKYGAKFFGNSSRPSGILSTVTPMDEKQQETTRNSWKENYGGTKQGGTAVLYGDWKWQTISVKPEEAQFLGTQVHSRSDVAALFRLPPHMIGDTSRLSNSNHEQQALEFVTDTLRPYLVRFEVEIVRKLLPRAGRKANMYSAKFDVRERLRGDFQTTMVGLGLGRQWAILTANDCRADLDMNPLGPEGDVLIYPINMGNAKALLHDAAQMPPVAAKAQFGAKQSPPAAKDGEVVEDESRAVVQRYGGAFARLFRDGYGRISAREERDSTALQAVFGSLLTAIQEQAAMDAAVRLGLAAHWNTCGERIVADALRMLTRHAADWQVADAAAADEAAGNEFRRVLKAIVTNTYREAGAAASLVITGAAA